MFSRSHSCSSVSSARDSSGSPSQIGCVHLSACAVRAALMLCQGDQCAQKLENLTHQDRDSNHCFTARCHISNCPPMPVALEGRLSV